MAKVQPKSPQDEGVDPLTKGEILYPREDTKTESEKATKEAEKNTTESDTPKSKTTESKTSSR